MAWLVVSIGVIILILLILALTLWKKKSNIPPDYYTLFVVGLSWFVVGFPMENIALTVIGVLFMIIGLVNKDKWQKNHKTWAHLTPEEKKLKMILMIVLGGLVALGIIFLVLKQNGLI